jgi:hypothetical protein
MLVCGHVFHVQCIERAWRVIHLPSPQPALPPGTTVINVDEEQPAMTTTSTTSNTSSATSNDVPVGPPGQTTTTSTNASALVSINDVPVAPPTNNVDPAAPPQRPPPPLG